MRIVRAGQLDEEEVGLAMRCPRDNIGREQSSIHGESNSCHASPNASLAATDGATVCATAQVLQIALPVQTRAYP